MRYIKDMIDGDHIQDIYLCKYKQSAMTKNGKAYDNVILQDKTGTIDAKIWEPNSMGIDEFDAMDYVEVSGEVTTFNGARQLNIKRTRRIPKESCNPADYLPVSSRDIEEMYKELMSYADRIRNPYMRKLVNSFFAEDAEFVRKFKSHSAAKTVHHGFVGGLLEHTLGVTRICDFFTKHYEVLQYDLLIPAAMFHDIGKMWEISSFPENDYTDDGQLLGHIAIGYELVGERIRTIEGFPPKLASELKHCILAHHGELEFGSPKKPAIVEAMALNFADVADDKLEMMREIFENAQGNDGWLGFNRFADSNLRRTSRIDVK